VDLLREKRMSQPIINYYNLQAFRCFSKGLNELLELLIAERQGAAPHNESELKRRLQLLGLLLIDRLITQGPIFLQPEQLVKLQLLGMDPNSEGNVYQLLKRLGFSDYLMPPDKQIAEPVASPKI
jgi:hypothetical protein